MNIGVDFSLGSYGEEAPLRLIFDGRTVDVAEIVDRWPAPDHTYVKLIGQDGATYILRHDRVSGLWRLVLFDRQRAAREPSRSEA